MVRDAVATIAATQGFREVTIRRVADAAGASTSVVTHYVRSRDELVRSTVRREIETRQGQADAAVAGLRGAAGLRALAEWAVLGPGEQSHRLWLAVVVGAQSESVLRAELDAFNAWWSDLVQGLVRELDPPPADPAGLVDALDVIVDGLVLNGFEASDPWSPRRRRTVLEALLTPLGV